MDWTPAAPTGIEPHGPLPPRRDIVVAILLAIFTFGVYILYWLYTTYRDTHQHLGKPHKAVPALVLAIVTFAIFIVVFTFYMITALRLGDSEPTGAALGLFFGSMGLMFLAALAMTGAQIWLMVGAAFGAEKVLVAHGRKPSIPAIVHVLVPIFVNIWTYVAIGLIQNDLNQLHPQS